WMVLKPVNYKPVPQQTGGPLSIKPAYKDKAFLYFIITTMFFASCFFQLFTNLPVFLRKKVHLSEPFIGLIMATNGIIIGLLEMVLVYKLEGRRKNTFYISVGVFLVALSFMLLNSPGISAAIAFGMICLVTMGEIFSLPFMNTYWIGRTQHSNRGQ